MAVVNADQENHGYATSMSAIDAIFIAAISFFPFLVLYVWVRKDRTRTANIANLFSVGAVATLGIYGYTMYLIQGASNPNSAGHMHVMLFPILLTCIAVLALLAFNLVGFLWGKVFRGNGT